MSDVTNLRDAVNKVAVTGILNEKNLEKKADPKNPGQNIISGNLVIKVGENETVTLNVAPMRPFTKAGKENPVYAGLETVINEYKSAAEYGAENADWVRVSKGSGSINAYYSTRRGREAVGYRMLSINRLNNVENPTPEAVFEIEVFIESIVTEMANNEPTGRVLVKCWLPSNIGENKVGVERITLIAPENIADAVVDAYKAGDTVRFYGNIVNKAETEVVKKSVKIGVAQDERRTRFTNELIITGASEAYDVDNPNKDYSEPFPAEAIKLAITEREHRIEDMKKNAGSNSYNSRPAAASAPTGGRKLPW